MSSRKTKKDTIVEELRAMIESGAIARGSRVQQNDLAAKFDTSITPVREALRQLEAEGLLVGEPHRGVRVASTDLEEVKAVYVMRRLVEPYAFCRASRRVSRRELEQARNLIEVMEQARADSDQVEIIVTNRAFHFLFYDRCGIPALTQQIEELWLGFPWDILQVLDSRIRQSVDEHRAILNAVETGDLQALSRAVELHVERSYLALPTTFRAEKRATHSTLMWTEQKGRRAQR